MDKYKLEKLRAQYEEARMKYFFQSEGSPVSYYERLILSYDETRSRYFAALAYMSEKEGARE